MPTKQRTNPVYTVSEFASRLEEYSEEDRARILKAAEVSKKLHSGQYRDSGEPFFVHPLQVADILRSLRMDPDTLIAALLHDVLEDTKITRQELRREYGRDVEALVNGVTKIALVKAKNKSVQEAQTIRKMLLAMVKDIRVILIKLADKLHNMRTLEFKEAERRRDIAQECLDIYAPLASRLGIAWIKDELEDLSLKNLHPDSYDYIRHFVAEKRDERSDYLERVRRTLETTIEKAGLQVTVETRAKHFYSIYHKMKKRGKAIDEIYDLLGIRIVCDTETECYSTLGLVHGLWPPIEGRFKDYIAMPKANQYQSLHTTVLSFGGKMIEIQIRTREMHETAEFGIAAHWFYKREALPEQQRREDLAILTKVRNLGGMRVTSSEFLDEIKREILKDSIYVFTPQGDAIQLPRGSTAIDFAYHIHTEVGNHTTGAKADGQIIPLKAELSNTQVIEILTSPNAHPHLNWLRYVRTSRARQKIRQWLNKHDENLIIDRSIVARKETGHPHHQQLAPKEPQHSRRILDKTKIGVRIGDERNMMIRFAGCCSPTTGDEIVGYVSRGRGIIVHRRDCKNVRKIEDFEERRIEVEWETVSPKATRRFRVVARKTLDLFSEIEGAAKKYHGHLIEGRIDENDNGRLEATFTMELERRDDFKRVMKAIRTVPSVLSITETTELVSAPG
ncbi:MAG: RelA/SpoT family protein [Spirochaetota bacterium]